jgi:hypothetical protein
LVTLSKEQYETLQNDLEKIGFWDILKASKTTKTTSDAFTEA